MGTVIVPRYAGLGCVAVDADKGEVRESIWNGLFAEAKHHDGNGDRKEPEPNDQGVYFGKRIDDGLSLAAAQSEGLEDGSHTVAQVGTQQGHRDHIKQGDRQVAESGDDHGVRVVGTEFRQGGTDANRVVENMENNKREDGRPAPDHHPRGQGGGDGVGIVVLDVPGGAAGGSELDGGDNVQQNRGKEENPRYPDAVAVQESMEEVGVVIKGVLPLEH